jgi:hypothetical protein
MWVINQLYKMGGRYIVGIPLLSAEQCNSIVMLQLKIFEKRLLLGRGKLSYNKGTGETTSTFK